MKDVNASSSVLERWVIGVLDAILLTGIVLIVAWSRWNNLQIGFILAAFAIGLLLVLSIAAWRQGFRWFFSRRALRFYAWLVAGVISVIVLFYAEEGWRGKRAWAALQRKAATRGESLALSSVIPPPVPDEDNFALAPEMSRLFDYAEWEPGKTQTMSYDNAVNLSFYYGAGRRNCPATGNWVLQQATDLTAWQKFFRQYPRTDGSATNGERAELAKIPRGYVPAPPIVRDPRHQFPVAAKPQTPAADVLLALSRNDSALTVLRAANQRPKVRYPVAYDEGWFATEPPHFFPSANFQAAVQVLCLRAVAELAQNRSEAALQDTLLALRVADSLRREPYEKIHHYRARMLMSCLQPVWEGLVHHRWNEAQLVTLQQRLADEDLLGEFRLAVRGETLMFMNLVDQLQARLDGRPSAWGDRHSPAQEEERYLFWLLRVAYPVGWLYQDKVWIYRFYERRTDVFKALDPANERQWEAEMRRATDPFLLIFVAPHLWQLFGDSATRALFLQTACQEASVACALERHRLTQGQYPDTLEALVPAWLKQVPADLLDPNGAKLRYHREAGGGFALYSIGLNRVDDQGKPGSPDQDWRGAQAGFPRLNEGDWVWVQPGSLLP